MKYIAGMGAWLMSRVNFEDNSKQVKENLKNISRSTLLSALLMVEAQAKSLARVDTGEMRDKIDHQIKEEGDGLIGQVGSPNQHAIYNEFGTGEFAERGIGRKGGWRYKDRKGKWRFTFGMAPRPFLRPAFRENKKNIQELFRKGFGGK